MYVFLLLLLVQTIAAVPLAANEWSNRVPSPNDVTGRLPLLVPEIIDSDYALQSDKNWNATWPCIQSEIKQHPNATVEEILHVSVVCNLKAGLKDSALLLNMARFRAVHGGLKPISGECAAAIFGLKWMEDPRLNASSVPLSKEDRQNVCKFLGDYHTEYCKVEEACADSRCSYREPPAFDLVRPLVLNTDAEVRHEHFEALRETLRPADVPFDFERLWRAVRPLFLLHTLMGAFLVAFHFQSDRQRAER
ncbi:hypothetical protein M3Y99_00903700 [Aphelenchoides fujianensis]|nr:hypothetical protein M3Y99_00902500 [Aphelenchoides fujianensis]KAI6233543.1 hypothetical protein M3Y99_00903700 [Aphelenchoides fujianensis]